MLVLPLCIFKHGSSPAFVRDISGTYLVAVWFDLPVHLPQNGKVSAVAHTLVTFCTGSKTDPALTQFCRDPPQRRLLLINAQKKTTFQTRLLSPSCPLLGSTLGPLSPSWSAMPSSSAPGHLTRQCKGNVPRLPKFILAAGFKVSCTCGLVSLLPSGALLSFSTGKGSLLNSTNPNGCFLSHGHRGI